LQRATKLALILTSGMLMQVDFSCTGVGEKLVNNVNPCGTILNCDPVEYDLLTTDFPDWDIDPTCTVPGQCGSIWPGYPGGAADTE
jgi:hypothetical protein